MRSTFGFLAALSLSASALAEDETGPLFSPEDDLDCALIFAHDLGEFHQEMNAEELRFYFFGYMYFVGRFEGARGNGIGPAMARRDQLMQSMRGEEMDGLAEVCGLRIDEMKVRVGEYITLAVEPASAEGSEEGSASKTSD